MIFQPNICLCRTASLTDSLSTAWNLAKLIGPGYSFLTKKISSCAHTVEKSYEHLKWANHIKIGQFSLGNLQEIDKRKDGKLLKYS